LEEQSNREIARQVGVNDHTVGKVREALQPGAQIAQVDKNSQQNNEQAHGEPGLTANQKKKTGQSNPGPKIKIPAGKLPSEACRIALASNGSARRGFWQEVSMSSRARRSKSFMFSARLIR
jgi:hypothetical protein